MNLLEFFKWHLKQRGLSVPWDSLHWHDKAAWAAAFDTWKEDGGGIKEKLNKECTGYNSGEFFNTAFTQYGNLYKMMDPLANKLFLPKKPERILNQA